MRSREGRDFTAEKSNRTIYLLKEPNQLRPGSDRGGPEELQAKALTVAASARLPLARNVDSIM